jgi:hypothetical protein
MESPSGRILQGESLGQNCDRLPDEELLDELLLLEELLLELLEDDDELEELDEDELDDELLEEELLLGEGLPPPQAVNIRVSARATQPPCNLNWVRMVLNPVVIDLY